MLGLCINLQCLGGYSGLCSHLLLLNMGQLLHPQLCWQAQQPNVYSIFPAASSARGIVPYFNNVHEQKQRST